jgi:hypothetical protein
MFCFLLVGEGAIFAQHDVLTPPPAVSNPDSIMSSQKDVIDIVNFILKRKTTYIPDSLKVKPGKLLFAILPGVGYTLVTGLTFVTSSNVSFYTGKPSTTNLSSVSSISEFSIFDHQILIPLESNIWTKGNKFNLLGDWRYYRYPTYTYGLGGSSSLSKADLIDYSYVRVYQEVLTKIHSNYYAGLGYNLDYHINIKEKGVGDFQTYNDNATQTVSSGMLFHLLYDDRKNVNNPLQGSFGSISYRPNLTYLGSDQNWQELLCEFRKYIKLSPNSDNVLAFWNLDWFTFGGKVPYFDLPSTGWDTYSNFGRGYIQGRLRGSNMLYLEGEYRFGILRNGLIGGVVFANMQSVSEMQTTDFKTFLPGGGVGLRFKVNKFSDANFCVDYGMGLDGSGGLFFNVCEVF